MSNAIKSYEGVFGLIKKYWCENLPLYYVPIEYDRIILNMLGELLSMNKFRFVKSYEILLEPIELLRVDRNIVVVMSMPLLNHYFNQPLYFQDNPVEFIKNSNPLKSLNFVSFETAFQNDESYSRKTDQLFNEYISPHQRYLFIQMMRIALLNVHVQQHYLDKKNKDTSDHSSFKHLELASRPTKSRNYSFFNNKTACDDADDDDDNDDNDNDYYDEYESQNEYIFD